MSVMKIVLKQVYQIYSGMLRAMVERLPFLVVPYYFVLSRAFNREIQTVFAGTRMYRHRRYSDPRSSPALRRNLHRIEKGMSMVPMRPVFAKSYAKETVQEFAAMSKVPAWDPAERRWARQVMDRYFEVIGSDRSIDAAKAAYHALPADEADDLAEKDEGKGSPFDVCMMSRKSVRSFKDIPVPVEAIRHAVAVGMTAPSACNRQPYRVVVVKNKPLLKEILDIPMGAAMFKDRIVAYALVIGDWAAFFSERDRHVPYVDASLFAMQFINSLQAAGISSCVVNWPSIPAKERAIAKRLRMGRAEAVVLSIAIGYAEEGHEPPESIRKSVDTVLTTIE